MQIPHLDENVKAWIETVSRLAAIIAGLFAIHKGRREVQQNRDQRAQELRWRQAQSGKELNDEMLDDPPARAAMDMLDYSFKSYTDKRGNPLEITTAEWTHGLRTTQLNLSAKDEYVRQCFDNLLYYMGILEHHISRGLVLFDDVAYPIEYYVERMVPQAPTLMRYIQTYKFHRSAAFLNRFPEWTAAPRS